MNLYELNDKMIAVSSRDCRTAMRLMVSCLKLIRSCLPEVALAGIETARRYWNDDYSVSYSALESARVDCWQYLEDRSASTNTEEPQYCAIRAAICVLYDVQLEERRDLTDCFNQMLRGALEDMDDDVFFRKVMCIVCEFRDEIEYDESM